MHAAFWQDLNLMWLSSHREPDEQPIYSMFAYFRALLRTANGVSPES